MFILDSDQTPPICSPQKMRSPQSRMHTTLASLSLLRFGTVTATGAAWWWARKAGQVGNLVWNLTTQKVAAVSAIREHQTINSIMLGGAGRRFRCFPTPIFHIYWKVNTHALSCIILHLYVTGEQMEKSTCERACLRGMKKRKKLLSLYSFSFFVPPSKR